MARILATALVALLPRRPIALENGFPEDTGFLPDEDAVLLATPLRFVSIGAEVNASGSAASPSVGGSAEPGTESSAAVLGREGALLLTAIASSAVERLGSSGAAAASPLQLGAGRDANGTLLDTDALQRGSNRTVSAADALQDALQHIDDARGAYLSYHVVNESKTRKSWRQDDVPNPLRDPSSCGQNESSWICDPEGLLGQLGGLLVANTTSNASEQGDDIGRLHSLVNKLQELPAPSRCEHFRMAILLLSALELGASQEAMGTFAEAMLERWNVSSSACGMLLLMSCADHRVFLATQVGVRGLLPHKVVSRIVHSMQEDMIHSQYLKAALMATTEVSAMLATWKPEPPKISVAMAGAAEAKALSIAGNILLCFSAGVALFCCLFWKACQRMPH